MRKAGAFGGTAFAPARSLLLSPRARQRRNAAASTAQLAKAHHLHRPPPVNASLERTQARACTSPPIQVSRSASHTSNNYRAQKTGKIAARETPVQGVRVCFCVAPSTVVALQRKAMPVCSPTPESLGAKARQDSAGELHGCPD